MGVNVIGLKSHTGEVRDSENGKLACNRFIGKMEVQGVTETADCESRGCSSRRVDEYPDVVHTILLRRPECALLD